MVGRTIVMRPMATWLLAGSLVAGVSACTTALSLEKTTALGPPFNEDLKQGYLELGAARWAGGSWEVLHFRDKARAAMLGDTVLPDPVTFVSANYQGELAERRQRLLTVLDAGARERTPAEAAEAQVSFDCWLSAVKASGQLNSGCREAFDTALGKSEQALVDALPKSYVVQFESGSDVIGSKGLDTVTAAAGATVLTDPAGVNVVGYADRSGGASYNEALSLRRAENVAAALEQAGIAADRLNVQAQGPAGATDDRRVEITFGSS